MKIIKRSGIYQLYTEQLIPKSLEEVWAFFSNPSNLDELTPKNMAFEVTSEPTTEMFAGQIITYKIEVFPNIKSPWVTEITHVKTPQEIGNTKGFFVDEQRFGPYAMWHHEHHFEKISENETKMIDRVSYKLPLGFLGCLFAGKLVKSKVQKIFAYRFQKIEGKFKI